MTFKKRKKDGVVLIGEGCIHVKVVVSVVCKGVESTIEAAKSLATNAHLVFLKSKQMQCNECFNQTRNYWQVPGPSYPTSLERGQDGDPNGISISSGSITIGKEVVQWSSNEA